MGGQPGKPKPPGNPPVRPEAEEPKPIQEPADPDPGSSSRETPCPDQSGSDILKGEMSGPARVSNPLDETILRARSAPMRPSIFVLFPSPYLEP